MKPARHVRFLLRPAILLALASCTFISDADVDAKFATGDTDADMDGVQASIDCDDVDPEVGAGDPWYLDVDGDSYGDLASPSAVSVCPGTSGPDGYVPDGSDCDDHDAAVHPSAAEVWYDGVDQDCDANDCDQDADGYCVSDYPFTIPDGVQAGDCDDTEASVHPSATEVWYDGIDQDCDANDCDKDADGYCVIDYAFAIPDGVQAGDCDDDDPAWNPGADESDCTDPNDYNCDGSTGFADADGDGVPACEECDDTSAASYPGALEVCDGVDNDCDGTTDLGAGDEATWYADLDGDGYGDPTTAVNSCADPGGYVTDGTDCDDAQASFHPGADELDCTDPNDYNCDGSVGFDDGDGDGSAACLDCDDANSAALPGGIEVCDGADNDCDGAVDLGASDAPTWYADSDADTFGDPATGTESCTAPEDYVADDTDCDDVDGAVNPDAVEVCDDADNDCDTTVDINAADASVWYADTDGDTFGDAGDTEYACLAPVDYVADDTDCDDSDGSSHPGGTEACDGADNDCDGTADDSASDAPTWYADTDGDTFGDTADTVIACDPPESYVADDTDCDDDDDTSWPGAEEYCDGVDHDCDAFVNEDDSVDAPIWCEDADLDGYCGTVTTAQCSSPGSTWSATNPFGDCDESDAAVSPGAVEYCDDLDTDCDGTVGDDDAVDATTWCEDADLDGYCGTVTTVQCESPGSTWSATNPTGDCDDADSALHADADGDGVCDAALTDYTTTYGSLMIAIPAGTFNMGGGAGDLYGEYLDHEVTLTHDFWIGEREVTQAEWSAWTGAPNTAPSSFGGYPDRPVETVSWYDVAKYANALSATEGLTPCYLTDGTDLAATYLADPYSCRGYRLPTEAEWEYAARASQDTTYSGSNTIGDVAWYSINSGSRTHDACGLDANAWGLCDMSGNVWEWTDDWYATTYDGYGTGSASTDPPGPTSGSARIVRGGGWGGGESFATVSYRSVCNPDGSDFILGFRLARSLLSTTNSTPSTPTVSLSPSSPTDSADLLCTGSSSIDPDGDTVSYTYAWTVDGVDAGIPVDAVPSAATAADEVWTCSVTATDGVASSAAATASVTIAADFADYTTTYGSVMLAIPAGTFTMGGGLGDPDNAYRDHEVTLTHDFWIGQTEITRSEWEADAANSGWTYLSDTDGTPCTGATADCPADSISWVDVARYANALSTAEGLASCYLPDGTELAAAYLTDPYSCPGYRMPTESEWEYAARAGEDTTYSGSNASTDVAWTYENAHAVGTYSHEVCTLAANAWGLCDMSGNTGELTNDWYDGGYGGYGDGAAASDPRGPSTGSSRVFRGGYWAYYAVLATVSSRDVDGPSSRNHYVGARLCRSSSP